MEEVKFAVQNYDSFKSLGPDGVNFNFIKYFLSKIKDDIMCFILEFHRNGKLTKGINCTFIALIHKVDSPQLLNDCRIISFVSSLYKILTKFLINRLRMVIVWVTSDTQSAFVKNWQMLNGILINDDVVD